MNDCTCVRIEARFMFLTIRGGGKIEFSLARYLLKLK